ncbi:MAG: septum formation inhibitor Maf [Fidelibacterota bacterium]|nr:MAG: septum formation inhibitor Maf [Candidatus Neomarinimicrobiota bacterium]
MGSAGTTAVNLILASASPRRQTLLARLGIPFQTVSPIYEEVCQPGETAEDTCRRLAQEKALHVAQRFPQDLVLGADTIVILNNDILGKPADLDDARRMLHLLSGKKHVVKTAVALIALEQGHQSGFIETTEVTFQTLEQKEIEHYLAVEPPLDKAGAYGIQDWSGIFVQRVNGCYHNVVGLPLARLYQHLKDTGLWLRLLTINHL